jgi:hypothetical protein
MFLDPDILKSSRPAFVFSRVLTVGSDVVPASRRKNKCLARLVHPRQGFSRMMMIGRNATWTTALLLSFALSAGGCLMSVADSPLAEPATAEAPLRAKDSRAYIPVHAVPMDRIEPTMDPGQRAKMQAELIAARDRQASAAVAKNPAAK